jgi:trimethylamine--corrinoid protein Co-methyltransferase
MKLGPKGGVLNPLSASEVGRIHEASLHILEECGLRCLSPSLLQVFSQGGAQVNGKTQMVRIRREVVARALELAPQSFVFHGRDPAYDLRLEQPRVYFGLGGSAVPLFLDHETGELRPSRMADMVTVTRVGQALSQVDFVMSLASACEVPEQLHYLYEYHAILSNTVKPVIYSAPSRPDAAMFLQMAAAACGGEAALRARPSVMLFTQPVSPLEIGDYNEGMFEFAAWGVPILYSPAPMLGASGPATLAGALAQGNAENLAGVVLSQLIRPGTPIVYGVHTPVLDMKTARCTYAGTEQALARSAMAQLARSYGLPVFCTGAGCDAKAVDAQAAAEATMGIFLNALSGLTLTQTMGTMGSGTFGSLEMLVICDEIVAMANRVIAGVEVSEETLAVDTIGEVGPGGHFLDHEHTLRHFRREFFFPRLFDREGIEAWRDAGSPRVEEVARARLRQILGAQAESVIPPTIQQALDACLARLAQATPVIEGRKVLR